MPRRRRRTTNRVRQEDRRLRVRGERRGTPDAKKLSRAFIGLAMARAEAEAQAEGRSGARRLRAGETKDAEARDGDT